MKKFKTPYRNIYDVLGTNRLIVIITVCTAFLTCTVSVWTVSRSYRTVMDSAFAVDTDGSVLPLKLVDERENLEVEALSHLDLFHNYFYGIDGSNYERNLERALWLGDGSVDNAYRQKRAEGVYNRLLQYSLVQRAVSVEPQVDLEREPYPFRTVTVFEVRRGSSTDRYRLVTTGRLIKVDRNFPNNTHGLLITDFFEESLTRINNEDQ